LQALLILTMVPHVSHGRHAINDLALLGGLLLAVGLAIKVRNQNIVTALVLVNTTIVTTAFGSLGPQQVFLPYPYFVILMMAMLGQDIRHLIISVVCLSIGYLTALYEHQLLSQEYLLLLPVLFSMAVLVTCHVFQAERWATEFSRVEQQKPADALTRLPQRATFIDRLGKCIEERSQYGDELFAVLFIDLDGFKAVNDQLGHRAGDEVLCAIGNRLGRSLRVEDMAARFGGDEFCVLLRKVHSKKQGMRVVERILEKLKAPIILTSGRVVTVGVSIGVAFSTNLHARPEDLIRDADAAMYRVKHQGKNGIAVSDQIADLSPLFSLQARSASSVA
jgi:diguanylate cyclase (GGDEF)-like protein